MRASVPFGQRKPLEVHDLELELPRAGEVLVRMAASGVCHGGLHAADGSWQGIPLPIALYTMLASPLQLLVSQAASAVLNAIGVPVLCQGNLMTLPGGVRMFVAEACSGMRQLTGFLALTAAVAYLAPRPWWYRAVLVASAVPIAMIANVVRVVLTGLIMHHLDPKFATGSFHTIVTHGRSGDTTSSTEVTSSSTGARDRLDDVTHPP